MSDIENFTPKDESIASKVEVLVRIHPELSWGKHSAWLEKAICKIQEEFDNVNDLTTNEKIKILNFVKDYCKDLSQNPMTLIRAIQQMPETKAKIALGMLQKNGLLDAVKKERVQTTWS